MASARTTERTAVAAWASGRDVLDKGLSVKIAKTPQVIWVAYRKATRATE